jgi:hypothetical protein
MTLDIDPDSLEAANVVDILRGISNETRAGMAERLHQLKHILLYSITPVHEVVRFDEMRLIHSQDDALTSGLKALMRSVCGRALLPAARCGPSD